jgi:hypothetical protein
VLSYRIDGYDPINNIAYEIDEPDHKHNRSKDNNNKNTNALLQMQNTIYASI